MLLGFFLVLILSDNRNKGLAFAADVKVIYILILSFFYFFDRTKFPLSSKIFLYFSPFLILGLALTFISDQWLPSFQKSLSYALIIFVIPNYLLNIYRERGSSIFKSIVYLFAIILFLGFVFKYISPEFTSIAGRYRGLFGNPNGLGIFSTLFFLFFHLVNSYFPELFSKREKVIVYALIIGSVLLCGSRNTLMSILIYLFFNRIYKVSPYLGFMIFGFILIGYEVLFQNFELIVKSLGLDDYFRIKTLETGSGRNIAWTFAWEKIQENFFFGKGFAYDELLYSSHYEELSIKGHQGNAHNSFLTIWINTGVFGLFFFIRAILATFFVAAKNSRYAFPILFAVAFSANFESWLAASLNPFTFLFLMMMTILISPEFNSNANENPIPV